MMGSRATGAWVTWRLGHAADPARARWHPTAPARSPDHRPTGSGSSPRGCDRRPPWLTVRSPVGAGVTEVSSLMRQKQLVTVCEEARCPNLGECWNSGTATFMIR